MLRRALLNQARRCSGATTPTPTPTVQARVLPCGSKATGTFHHDTLLEGTLIAADGTKRSGVFTEGKLTEGRVYLPDGRIYTGIFKDGVPQDGTLEDEGALYEGPFNKQWQRHGKGVERRADGGQNEGLFADDWLSEGEVTIPADGARSAVSFTGTLKEGRFHQGTLKYQGMLYVGALESNNPHGKGRLELPDGSVREGLFAGGVLHGNGMIVLKNGTVVSGVFKEGTLPNGSIKWTQGDLFEGDLDSQHRPHGDGAMYKSDERHWWSGQWTHGTFSGGSVTDEGGAPVDYRTAPPKTTL